MASSASQRSTEELLEAELVREMAASWRDGQMTSAEEWIARRPEIAFRPELATRIIYEEICQREQLGDTVHSSEIYRRFPQWRDALEIMLDCHRLMQPDQDQEEFPEAGERLGEFELLCELGRGAVGRVFLATQPSLSDRPLVVKLTPRHGDEHLSLARLQHTHIAPLYLVQDFPNENLRALCMPYVGGASWSQILHELKAYPLHQRTGRQIAEVLAKAQLEAPIAADFTGPALHFLNRATYVQAVCWIGACLADALQYAHQRGLMHLDLKPSNVLLSGDGQPMLLDFHLAREVIEPGNNTVDRLGGTRGYMSPEQQLAATAVLDDRPIALGLDGRSDIFSLGVLLYESLAGGLPSSDERISRRDLQGSNPEVTRGVEDLVHKCLAHDLAARYKDAGELAEDLRRHLANLPLRGVPNRSLTERWKKWRRRQPHMLLLAGMAFIAVAVVAVAGSLFVSDRLQQARKSLADGQRQIDRGEFGPAIHRLQAGWDALRWLPGQQDLRENLQTQISFAQRASLAQALHALVDQLHFVDSFDDLRPGKLQSLEEGCSKVWQARTQILQSGSPAMTPDIERDLRNDLLDLALLWADLKVRLAPASQLDQARRDAVRLLEEAEGLCESSPVLDQVRQHYKSALDAGGTNSIPRVADGSHSISPQTVWEHYAVGRSLFRTAKIAEAQTEFQRAIDLKPNAFWPNFYQMLCAYRLQHFDEALNSACICVALDPTRAECFYNRGLARQALGHSELALNDFDKTLELEPTLAVAALHRGMLRGELRRFDEATRDLTAALAHGADPAAVHYQLALIHLAQEDRQAALESLRKALQHDAHHGPAAALQARLTSSP
jgi:serine/threonine protein kinase/Tfp pilus assembly protein PilF